MPRINIKIENGYKMVTLSLGNKKRTYRSIKEAAEVNGIPYMTLYMRLRFGNKPLTAIKKPVRKYSRKVG
jgi:hypothetical protein